MKNTHILLTASLSLLFLVFAAPSGSNKNANDLTPNRRPGHQSLTHFNEDVFSSNAGSYYTDPAQPGLSQVHNDRDPNYNIQRNTLPSAGYGPSSDPESYSPRTTKGKSATYPGYKSQSSQGPPQLSLDIPSERLIPGFLTDSPYSSSVQHLQPGSNIDTSVSHTTNFNKRQANVWEDQPGYSQFSSLATPESGTSHRKSRQSIMSKPSIYSQSSANSQESPLLSSSREEVSRWSNYDKDS